jgi:hypothetical protein
VGSQRRPKQQKEVKIMKHQFTIKKRILIMRHNKIVSAAIALCMVAFFTMGSVPSSATPTPVTITAVFDFSTFPDVTGTFTTSGALTISGPATMHVDLLNNGTPAQPAHCVVTLLAPNGTIIIDQQCQFATSPPRGRWEIVSGTGAYANLNGNGSLTMPPNTEAMTGFIYQ